jgi:hypothetical protein
MASSDTPTIKILQSYEQLLALKWQKSDFHDGHLAAIFDTQSDQDSGIG